MSKAVESFRLHNENQQGTALNSAKHSARAKISTQISAKMAAAYA